jgi:plastocyanin
VTSDTNLFDSGPISNGATFSYTFNEAGTFNYHCNVHPSMLGKVTVQ